MCVGKHRAVVTDLMDRGYKKRYGDLLKYDVEEEIVRFKVS